MACGRVAGDPPVGLQEEYLVNVCIDRVDAVHLGHKERETLQIHLEFRLVLLHPQVKGRQKAAALGGGGRGCWREGQAGRGEEVGAKQL